MDKIDREKWAILVLLRTGRREQGVATPNSRRAGFAGSSSLPIRPFSVISPTFIARLIKGCRGGVSCGFRACSQKPEHNQRSNEHF
ncbi:hypothetical protein KUL72_00670 [Bradyrhizobium arachidis]|uniref:hypothetical protein n=1 Tax=Bradyrhizobium TaxID=374 RepID=UPI0021636FDE|nr:MULTISPECIES: hypothetical protein [Bradyrhizobium]MDN4987666.1 hypothetical protein [Bradyrhizobium sp. WYCCWR 13022]UVO40729.1 hypothetical protein KUL72_00670 [Bradyrhizobium arachidis]